MNYSPEPKPLSKKLEKILKKKSNFPPTLIGWDVYVDIDGNVGFYEGNSCPFGIPAYQDLFGNDLNRALVNLFKDRGIIGVNANLETEFSPLIQQEAGFIIQLFRENKIPTICSRYTNLDYDGELYFNEYGNTKRFNTLFNRVPKSGAFLRALIPKEEMKKTSVVNPLIESLVLTNKMRTKKALEEIGIESPFALRADNITDYYKASEKVMAHIEANHPNYQPPFILSKPIAGTGQKGIRIFDSPEHIDYSLLKFPCLVSERITSWPCWNKGKTFAADMRFFSAEDYASQGIAKIPPKAMQEYNHEFPNRAYITNRYILKVSDDASEIIQKYIIAASIAIHQAAIKYAKELK